MCIVNVQEEIMTCVSQIYFTLELFEEHLLFS